MTAVDVMVFHKPKGSFILVNNTLYMLLAVFYGCPWGRWERGGDLSKLCLDFLPYRAVL